MTGQLAGPRGGRIRRLAHAHGSAWLLFAAIALGAALRFRLLSLPFERDEGEYAYAGQLMLQGLAPYEFAYTMKLPGVSAIYAGLMLVFGQTHQGIHLGLLFINALTCWLVFALGRRLVGSFAGIAAAAFFAITSTLPAVQGLWANAEHFVLPFALAGILSYFHWCSDPRARYLMISGALLGCGILMKQHGAAFFVFVGFCLGSKLFVARTGQWQTATRAFASLVGGAALPIVLVALIVFSMGSFDKFWYWTVEYATSYAAGNSLERGWLNFLRNGGAIWQQATAIGLMAAAAPLCLDWSPARRFASAHLLLFALLSFLAVCPGLFFRPHYFILLLPAASILAGASLDRCYRILRDFTGNEPLRALPGVAAVVITLATLGMNQDDLLHATPDQVLHKTYGISPFSASVSIGSYLREHTQENETIAVIGSEPQIYFYAQRKSATGHIYTYPLMEDRPEAKAMQLEMAREIEAASPKYLVFVNDAGSWMKTKRSTTLILDWFSKYKKRYQIVGWSEAGAKTSTVYWGKPASWPPKSKSWIAIYRRNEAQESESVQLLPEPVEEL
jgi:hypothetical protein